MNPTYDLLLIFGPSIISSVIVLVWGKGFESHLSLNPLIWLVFVVGVDVAHVYSTLFRSYFHRRLLERHKNLFFYAPIFLWVLGVLVHSIDRLYFWRVLAYFAVFHFTRQQYGFFAIYSQQEWRENHLKLKRFIDKVCIYSATILPILYWHSHARSFEWFIEGDFFYWPSSHFDFVLKILAIFLFFTYTCSEIILSFKRQSFNWPKNILLLSTALSWTIGIVVFNSDFSFTLTNVLSHGIPYLALVWWNGRKDQDSEPVSPRINVIFVKKYGWIAMLIFLWFLAYMEEGLWAGIIWKEHLQFFPWVKFFNNFDFSAVSNFVVPLLALPQAMHYLFDAYIWKLHGVNAHKQLSKL